MTTTAIASASASSTSTSNKVRFDGLDVLAMVSQLQQTCIGRRIVNIYDGNNPETYIFKLDGTGPSPGATSTTTTTTGTNTDHTAATTTANTTTTTTTPDSKVFVLIESGIRFHTISSTFTAATTSGSSSSNSHQPTPFCMKLRKHLRGLRLEQIQQIGMDRVILIQCGVGNYKHTIIVELYSKGNLILTDHQYSVLALLRSHTYTSTSTTTTTTTKDATTNSNSNSNTATDTSAVLVQVGQVYPVSYATSIGTTTSSTTPITETTIPTTTTTTADGDDVNNDSPTDNHHHHNNHNQKNLLGIEQAMEFNAWVHQYVEQSNTTTATTSATTAKKKKNKSNSSITIKMVLSQQQQQQATSSTATITATSSINNNIHHYGPALIEHCLRIAQLDPNRNLLHLSSSAVTLLPAATTTNTSTTNPPIQTSSTNYEYYTQKEWERLREVLHTEGIRILQNLQNGTLNTGYILYRPMLIPPSTSSSLLTESSSTLLPLPATKDVPSVSTSTDDVVIHDSTTMETFDFSDKRLIEFQPVLLKQHQTVQYIQFHNFSLAVEIYFDHMTEQRNNIRAMNAERAAITKLEKVRNEQQVRIESLYEQQNLFEQQAITIQYHAENVDKALLVINSALSSGMSWDQIIQIVHVEQHQNQNPIALLIQELDFENNAMIVRLPTTTSTAATDDDGDGSDDEHNNDDGKPIEATTLDVRVLLQETAYANSNRLFAQYRAYKEKSIKTVEASSKVFKAAEETAKRQLADAVQKRTTHQNGSNGMTTIGKRSKIGWYEKFHWFITSDNYLVIGGKDAQQNEALVKRYLRNGDAYLHADVHGASSCILRAKRRRTATTIDQPNGKTNIVPLSEQALREAGNFTICHSSAWTNRIITSAWWVEAHQVSKTAPTGEYLTVGSFMIRGKKNFLPPTSPLEMGIGVLFRLADDESILRHANERRDFALLNDAEPIADIQTVNMEKTERTGTNTLDTNNIDKIFVVDEEAEEEIADVKDDESESRPELDDGLDDNFEAADSEALSIPINSNDNDDIEDVDAHAEPQNDDIAVEIWNKEDVAGDESLSTVVNQKQVQKRGLSVRDRKLIKKYGSLEAAEKISELQQLRVDKKCEADDDDVSSVAASTAALKQLTLKRGQKSKLKRVEKKYVDQDEEDRTLAMLALQGGEKQKKKTGKLSGKGKNVVVSEKQQKVASETVALLVKDTTLVVQKLPDNVKAILAECVTIASVASTTTDNDNNVPTVLWEKFDADTLEQLLSLTPLEAQVAAATRLLNLKKATRIDNFSASLGGIIRTIRKHGYESMELTVDPSAESAKRKTKAEREKESAKWKDVLDDEGIVDGDIDKDAIDDTVEISKMTGKPHPDDLLLYAIPVCGPYQSLSQYSYRVKLTPGGMKRGKSSKQCLDILLKTPIIAAAGTEKHLELIKKVVENDWVQTICGDVKISAPGASKASKQNKANAKNQSRLTR